MTESPAPGQPWPLEPAKQRSVLFVDDEPGVVEAFVRAFRQEDFTVRTAGSAAEALAVLEREPVDVVVADERMPGMSGSELLARVSRAYPSVYQIMLSGQAGMDTAVRLLNEGNIWRFLTKPCPAPVLAGVIREALGDKGRRERLLALSSRAASICSLDLEPGSGTWTWSAPAAGLFSLAPGEGLDSLEALLARVHAQDRPRVRERFQDFLDGGPGCELIYRLALAGGAERWISQTADVLPGEAGQPGRVLAVFADVTGRMRQEEAIREGLDRLRATLEKTVSALSAMAEKRDLYTAGHQARVAAIAQAICRRMGLDPNRTEGVRTAAILHDIGKIAVPSEYLVKPAALSPLERAIVQVHPQAGHDILKDIPFPWPVAAMVLQHHERMDGSGYPSGLRGEAIMPEARILAVADVMEAISSHRPYRAALGGAAALVELTRHTGTLYDPEAAAAGREVLLSGELRAVFRPSPEACPWPAEA